MFIILIIVMVSQVYSYVKAHQIIHFKCVQFFLCKLYHNRVEKIKMENKRGALHGVILTDNMP